MKKTEKKLSFEDLDKISDLLGKLETVRDTGFSKELFEFQKEFLEEQERLVIENKEKIDEVENKLKEMEAENKKRDEILQKYAKKDGRGGFELQVVKDETGKEVHAYTFPNKGKMKEKMMEELNPQIEIVKKKYDEYQELFDKLNKEKLTLKLPVTIKTSLYFNLKELKLYEELSGSLS